MAQRDGSILRVTVDAPGANGSQHALRDLFRERVSHQVRQGALE